MSHVYKIGDKFKVTLEEYPDHYGKTYSVSALSNWLGREAVYCIDDKDVKCMFTIDEINPVFDLEIEQILVVNKVNPQFSSYVDCTEESIKNFFKGTRLPDWYVIKNNELIQLNKEEDVSRLTKATNWYEKLSRLKLHDHIELDGKVLELRGKGDTRGKDKFYFSVIGNDYFYLKHKDQSVAWYTAEQFAEMIEKKTYQIKG